MPIQNELFQATIWQKFIYKYPLFAFDAASKKFDEILVLEAGYEFDFIHELTESLNWIRRKSFDRYVLIVSQPTLVKCTCIFTWEINRWLMLSWEANFNMLTFTPLFYMWDKKVRVNQTTTNEINGWDLLHTLTSHVKRGGKREHAKTAHLENMVNVRITHVHVSLILWGDKIHLY